MLSERKKSVKVKKGIEINTLMDKNMGQEHTDKRL
jgi:hypothetical protein